MSKVNLSVDYCGLKLKNPIVAASAGTTRDAERARRCSESGYGAVVLKSIQEEEMMRYNPFPRFAVVHSGIPGYSSDTFYSYEQAFMGDIDQYCTEIVKCKKQANIPIIGSINCINAETWAKYAVAVEQAGADALELVPSCPTGAVVRDKTDIHSLAINAVKNVKEVVKIPVALKMNLQLANPLYTAKCLQEAGADSLIMFNRPTGIEMDINTMAPILHKGFAGHGGPWARLQNMRWMVEAYPTLNIPISATSGAVTWQDVVKYMLAGATNVQVCALMYLKGFDSIKELLAGLEEYLEKKGIANISEIIGKGAIAYLPLPKIDRSKRYYAQVDKSECIACGLCKNVCIYDAISYDRGPDINPDACDGCGLCASVCSKKHAITMLVKQ
jgi:dihydroorotate dehydrogenase (fumarate)